jgi:protein-S-isoprenylcysteine O-methyltransferase Ste14
MKAHLMHRLHDRPVTMRRVLASKLIIQIGIFVALGSLLFLSAGTLQWPAAWVLLVEMGGTGIALGLWLRWHDPALFAERLSACFQSSQKRWDKVFMATLLVLWSSWFVLMGVDAVRFRWSYVPVWAQAIGAILIALNAYIAYRTFRENTFAAPVVKIQTERDHRVVSTGPYAYVRHPMYAGNLLFFIGTPLLLGSWYGHACDARGARGADPGIWAAGLSRLRRARALSPHPRHLVVYVASIGETCRP